MPALQLNHTLLAEKLVKAATKKSLTFGTAESCTGGLISATVTDVSGASAVYYGSVISYDNSIKENVLHVKKETLLTVGAVSEDTARQMAEGVKNLLQVDFAVSVTGIAGPTGGTKEKPVGLVYIGIAKKDGTTDVLENHFTGNREEVRAKTVEKALTLLLDAVNEA